MKNNIIMLILCIVCMMSNSFGQATDNCSNQTVGSGGIIIDMTGATASGLSSVCEASGVKNRYLRMIVDQNGEITNVWDGNFQGTGPIISYYNGSCNTLTYIDCFQFGFGPNMSHTISGLTPGDTITATISTDNLDITVGMNLTGLPVTIAEFSGNQNKFTNELKFIYFDANNSSHVAFEKSKDGRTFELFTTAPIQNGTEEKIISVLDQEPFGSTYYRVKIVDIDGSHEYSDLISVRNDAVSNSEFFTIYPNPTSGFVNITGIENELVEPITMYNSLGQLIKSSKERTLDLTELNSGMYVAKYGQHVTRIIKK